MDVLFLRELRVEAVIGVHDWERRIRQTLVFDLELATNVPRAAATDNLADALDYAGIAERINEFVQASELHLLESLAEGVAALLLEQFQVQWLRLSVAKLHALSNIRLAGIVIERERTPT